MMELLTILELYLMSYLESTKRMFSGLRSVCVNLLRCRTDGNKVNNKVTYYYEMDLVVYHSYKMVLIIDA